MSLRYTHTLIPTSPTFTPIPAQVQSFLTTMLARDVIAGQPTLTLRTPSAKTRQARNPFTGEVRHYPMTDHQSIPTVSQVATAIAALRDYHIGIAGTGRPANPPLPLDFDQPYHLGITCVVSSILRSTSDPHEESEVPSGIPFHGDPCTNTPKVGYFTNPHTLELIKVRSAGCARFWIEFELGNNLFPRFDDGTLNFIDPLILHEAEKTFGTRFVQACNWG